MFLHKIEGSWLTNPFWRNEFLLAEDDQIGKLQKSAVQSIWIDLSRDTYGIHGTPDPSKVGKTFSSGCVRLTNWDAEQLASKVKPGVRVIFR